MTAHHNHTSMTGTGPAPHHAREGSHGASRGGPRRMPAGGWIGEIATGGNWRTTTIVRRHRHSTAMPSP